MVWVLPLIRTSATATVVVAATWRLTRMEPLTSFFLRTASLKTQLMVEFVPVLLRAHSPALVPSAVVIGLRAVVSWSLRKLGSSIVNSSPNATRVLLPS